MSHICILIEFVRRRGMAVKHVRIFQSGRIPALTNLKRLCHAQEWLASTVASLILKGCCLPVHSMRLFQLALIFTISILKGSRGEV